jgi:fluoride ion exporter CrcB/FEX
MSHIGWKVDPNRRCLVSRFTGQYAGMLCSWTLNVLLLVILITLTTHAMAPSPSSMAIPLGTADGLDCRILWMSHHLFLVEYTNGHHDGTYIMNRNACARRHTTTATNLVLYKHITHSCCHGTWMKTHTHTHNHHKDGSHTVLGHQIPSALFGYVVGMMTALGSFRAGRLVAGWKRVSPSSSSPMSSSSDVVNVEEEDRSGERHAFDRQTTTVSSEAAAAAAAAPPPSTSTSHQTQPLHNGSTYGVVHSLHFVTLGLVALTLTGCLVSSENQEFYKELMGVILVAPLGALSRWKLSTHWNTRPLMCMGRQPLPALAWMPWGTFLANTIGCLVSILCTGVLDRFNINNDNDDDRWSYVILTAIRVGFAGSLSTVSTMIKEIVLLQDKEPRSAQPTIYGTLSCLTGMTLGLVVYMLLVRIET